MTKAFGYVTDCTCEACDRKRRYYSAPEFQRLRPPYTMPLVKWLQRQAELDVAAGLYMEEDASEAAMLVLADLAPDEKFEPGHIAEFVVTTYTLLHKHAASKVTVAA